MSEDFIVTVHAFERLEERFPQLIDGMSDVDQAKMVHGEVMDALDGGRYGTIPPIELSSNAVERWLTRTPGSYYVWTKDKKRGYLLNEDKEEGMLVITVVVGRVREQAMSKLWRRKAT